MSRHRFKQYRALNVFLEQSGKSFHVKKIHPLDLGYLLNSNRLADVVTLKTQLLLIDGKMYMQTVTVRPKHKDIV